MITELLSRRLYIDDPITPCAPLEIHGNLGVSIFISVDECLVFRGIEGGIVRSIYGITIFVTTLPWFCYIIVIFVI